MLLSAALFTGVSAKAGTTAQTWTAGSNTWDAGSTADWSGAVWANSNNRNTLSDSFFNGTAGTVTVDDSKSSLPVTFGYMEFKGGSGWVISGGTLDNVEDFNSATVVKVDAAAGNVTISSQLNIAPNPTNGSSNFYNYAVGSTLKLGNLNISSIAQSGTYKNGVAYTNQTTPSTFYNSDGSTYTETTQSVQLFALNGTTIEVDGNYTTDTGLSANMLIGNYNDSTMSTGTYIFKGALNDTRASAKQFDFGSGNIVFATSSTGSGTMTFVGNGGGLLQTMLTSGSQTISNAIGSQSASNAEIGGLDNSVSSYTGTISAGASQGALDLHAGTSGTVTFANTISGNNGTTTKDGAGTVILGASAGNTWTSYVADVFEMKAGTTLIENSTGNAFGNGAATTGLGTLSAQVDTGATLGGTGVSTTEVVAQGATSVIAPGTTTSATQTLTLSGGLVATSGLTMDFTLNGAGSSDQLKLGTGAFSLGGTVTVNFATLDTVKTGTAYTLVSGTGNWTEASGTTFALSAPTGYKIKSYSISTGTSPSNVFTVQFDVVPEPSTWAMLAAGLLSIGGLTRLRRLV